MLTTTDGPVNNSVPVPSQSSGSSCHTIRPIITEMKEMGASYLASAFDLAARGWSLLPVKPGTKEAALKWKKYQKRRPTQAELLDWFGKQGIAGAIAVILGKASGGLACRDFDDEEAYLRWCRQRPNLAAALPTVKTHRGFHVYFRGPEDYVELEDGEYRADSGHYCLVPPSAHPKGGRYQWVVPLPSGSLPEIDNPTAAGLIYHPPTIAEVNARGGGVWRGEGREGKNPPSVLTGRGRMKNEVDIAIFDTLPPGPGHRHRCVFELARRLRALPRFADAQPEALLTILERWHKLALPAIATKEYAVTRRDFIDGWKRVRFPAGQGAIDQLWTKAGDERNPIAGFSDSICRLIHLCQLLQSQVPGESFFLSCRTVGRLARASHVAAWKWLRKLEQAGILHRVETGSYDSGKSSEYRFTRMAID
jgi:hypothetical protein